jgi:cytochrome b pre-mRNA-processing protein 3
MLQRLLGRLVAGQAPAHASSLLYDVTASQARQPDFFLQFAFPDTVLGRLDVLHLHLFLLTRRLGHAGDARLAALSQEVFDRHIDALDVALRQLGVGDLSVPKRKKRMVREFYGLVAALDRTFVAPNRNAIAEALDIRFYGGKQPRLAAELAAYLQAAVDALSKQDGEAFLAGAVSWPPAGAAV